MNSINNPVPASDTNDLARHVEGMVVGLQACDFVLAIADMKEKGVTETGLGQFETDALRFLGIRRLPDETPETFFWRIADWPVDGFMPALRRNGIPMKVPDDFFNDMFNNKEGQ